MGIAQKASEMGRYYGYDKEMQSKLFFAGAVHVDGDDVLRTDGNAQLAALAPIPVKCYLCCHADQDRPAL